MWNVTIPYTHVEGDGEKGDDEDEADSEHEGIIEESENEEDYHDNIYDNDDDQTQSAYDPTPLSAYNPPPHMLAFAIVEDRHPSIKSAYENPQNGWTANTSTHVYCIRHSAQNFMREIKDKKHRKFVVNMGYAINRPTFAYYHNEIAALNDKELKWG
ncbi:hypothetical protein P8452_60583 [Trifolium repens]|nr:hypothetical protein P8452_60583 [Trifolium repens]